MEAEKETDGNQGDREHMRDDLMEGISEEDGDHHQAEYGIFEKEHMIEAVSDAVFIEHRNQDQGRDNLYQQVVPMDASTAVFAFSLQDDVTDDGDIEVKRDLVSARGAG